MSGWETWGVHLSLIIPVLLAEGAAQSAAAASRAQAVCAVLHFQSAPAAPPAVACPFFLGWSWEKCMVQAPPRSQALQQYRPRIMTQKYARSQ